MLSTVETLKEFKNILLGQILRIYKYHKNLERLFLNTDRVLIWRFILEEYGSDIEYIKGDKNIVAYTLSIFTSNGNQHTTQEYTYKKEIAPETNDTKELPEGIFLINLIVINQNKWK